MTLLLALAGVSAAVAPGPGTGGVIYALAAALIAAVGGSAFQFYKYRRQAEREDDSLIAAATGEAVAAAKEMLQEYRLELQRAREEMTELRGKLDSANRRIERLEGELRSVNVGASLPRRPARSASSVRGCTAPTLRYGERPDVPALAGRSRAVA